jgi:hypothetical protein
MQEQLNDIRSTLGEEIVCYRELLSVAERERDILLKGSHQELMDTVQLKLDISQRLAARQGERRRLLEALSPDKRRPLRLRDLVGFLPPEEQGPFRTALGEAQRLAQRLGDLSAVSKRYVEEALDTVEHLLAILTGQGRSQAQGYAPHGQRPAPVRSRILARAV